MPLFVYWGDDDYLLSKSVAKLVAETVDPAWQAFNYDRISPDGDEAIVRALNQAITPPFGMGNRLVWLVDTSLMQGCSDRIFTELERTLPILPNTTNLLLTSDHKPDARLKSTKVLQKYGQIKEFAAIPPWKTDEIIAAVREMAKEIDAKITPKAAGMLVDAVGNNSRNLYGELEKLQLFVGEKNRPIEGEDVNTLINRANSNSLQLANHLRQGNISAALATIAESIARNEPALRISATLIGQFRTWLLVKVAMESGENDDKKIAAAADLNNPKRVYILKKELWETKVTTLIAILPKLLELEWELKRGGDPVATLQTKAIEICQVAKNKN
jgi:DNA polymerase-3 subunit delta